MFPTLDSFFPRLEKWGLFKMEASGEKKIIIIQSDNCSMDKREAELPMTCPSGAGASH